MRMLPVYFLIDVSESMIGDTMRQLDEGLAKLSDTLKTIPEALETAQVSIIAFAGKAKVITPMVEVANLYPPRLPIGGGTSLGAALELLMERIDHDVTPTTPERKGDWKPIVFLLTDGVPTDNPGSAMTRWKSDYARKASLVSISVGGRADLKGLREISDKTMILNDISDNAFANLITWVTQSITIQSQSVGIGAAGDGVNLSKNMPDELAEDDGISAGLPDDRYAVVIGKCETNELPFLLKYEKSRHQAGIYEFRAAQGVSNQYFELCADGGAMQEMNVQNLMGGSSCPHCPNEITMAHCGKCGGIHCLDVRTKQAVCPWCGGAGTYGASAPGEGFNVNRGLG
ncbi:TerY-C metal binding domain-containing protein [Yoonia sp. R2-816]|uniref:TerY-C metal binding domain-containing protein n=1 Tax=Yoonia sp. R2-816 TaxID=3342638 RepID=UPI00372CB1D8